MRIVNELEVVVSYYDHAAAQTFKGAAASATTLPVGYSSFKDWAIAVAEAITTLTTGLGCSGVYYREATQFRPDPPTPEPEPEPEP